MSEGYHSLHTGKVVDDAVTLVTDEEAKIKWGNIRSGAGYPSISAQTDLYNFFTKRSGDTMTGNLILSKESPQLTAQMTNSTKGVNPAENVSSGFVVVDGAGLDSTNRYGALISGCLHSNVEDSKGISFTRIFAYNPALGSSDNDYIGIQWGEGGAYTYAPTPAANDSSNKIATTAWVSTASGVVHIAGAETITGAKSFSGTTTFTGSVNLNGTTQAVTVATDDSSRKVATTEWVNSATNIVHITGAETISGVKTFSSNIVIEKDLPIVRTKVIGVTKGSLPADNKHGGIVVYDEHGLNTENVLGRFETYTIASSGDNSSRMIVYKPEANSTDSASITIQYASDGTITTSAPTPKDASSNILPNDNSTQLATTEWVKSCLADSSTNILSGDTSFKGTYLGTFTSGAATANISGSHSTYTIYMNGASSLTFSLPSVASGVRYYLHQILVNLRIGSTLPSINWGTSHYFHGVAPTIAASKYYTIIYEYNNLAHVWTIGAILKN